LSIKEGTLTSSQKIASQVKVTNLITRTI